MNSVTNVTLDEWNSMTVREQSMLHSLAGYEYRALISYSRAHHVKTTIICNGKIVYQDEFIDGELGGLVNDISKRFSKPTFVFSASDVIG